MIYHRFISSIIGFLPFHANITGRRPKYILSVFDFLFRPSDGIMPTSVFGEKYYLDLAQPSERVFFYMPQNLLRYYQHSGLYRVMKILNDQVSTKNKYFIDVGANLGIYSILAKGMGYSTVLFEPEPVHYKLLSRNKHYFDVISNVALSNEKGYKLLHVSKLNPGASSLVNEDSLDQSIYSHSVQVISDTLANAINKYGLEACDIALIKIDVEGYESEVVEGMSDLFKRDFNPIIWCEVRGPSSTRGHNTHLSVTNQLTTHGYTAYKYDHMRLSELSFTKDDIPQVFDLLFAKADLHHSIIGHL